MTTAGSTSSLRDPFRGAPSIVHSHRALLSPRLNGKAAGVSRQSDTQRRTFFDSQEDAHGARRTVSLNRNPSNGGGEKGIGIVFGRPEVGTDDGGASLPYTIHRVSRDGTAFQSGLIHEGDLLMKVNGASVADMTAEQITAMILGKPSSAITVTVETPPAQALKHQSPAATPASALHTLTPGALRSMAAYPPTRDVRTPSVSPPQRSARPYSSPSPLSSRSPMTYNGGPEPSSSLFARQPLEAFFISSPQPMPVVVSEELGGVPGSHQPIPDLRFEASAHSGLRVESNGKMASNIGGAYLACIRLTPAVPSTGKWRALLEITRPGSSSSGNSNNTDAISQVLREGCGSFVGVCDPERHNAATSRAMGSAQAWMVSLRTGSRFHNGRDLPEPYASPAPPGSIIAVMIDMDNKLTRIQVDGDIPGATFKSIPDAPGGVLCVVIDLCRGDTVEILPREER